MAGVVSSTEDQVSWFCSVFFHFAANFQSIQIQMLLSSSISTFPLLLFLFIFGFKFPLAVRNQNMIFRIGSPSLSCSFQLTFATSCSSNAPSHRPQGSLEGSSWCRHPGEGKYFVLIHLLCCFKQKKSGITKVIKSVHYWKTSSVTAGPPTASLLLLLLSDGRSLKRRVLHHSPTA